MKKNTDWALSWPKHANICGKTESKANGERTFSLFSVVCLLGWLVPAQYDFGWFCTVWLWLVGWCLCLCLHSMTGWLVGIFAYACTVTVWLSTTMDSAPAKMCSPTQSTSTRYISFKFIHLQYISRQNTSMQVWTGSASETGTEAVRMDLVCHWGHRGSVRTAVVSPGSGALNPR